MVDANDGIHFNVEHEQFVDVGSGALHILRHAGLPDTLSRVSVDDCDAADVPFVLFAARLGLDASKMHSTVVWSRSRTTVGSTGRGKRPISEKTQ